MKPYFSFLLAAIIGCSIPLFSQTPTQTLKGTILDYDTKQPLQGATVAIVDLNPVLGAVTDSTGSFLIKEVPVGRRTVRCTYIGYETYESDGIIVNSVKEAVLELELQEHSVTTNTVTVTAVSDVNEPVNEVAVVSTRSFSPEETGRYAASVNDPGRMALAFPGVQQGRDDGENDIIIRGNSSIGMLWRLEGIDIPNPNHFARPGTSGGGITVFSAQLLGQSDFSSGALPAEYGNAISGAMDVHFRKGNRTEREHRIRLSLVGLDFMAEGPIQKGRSSYLVNYRYSTLGLLSSMGFYLVGERVTNKFQDLSFNLAFDGKSGKDFVTVFGIGGLSQEHYLPVEDPAERELGVANNWEDRLRTSNMAATGLTYTRLLDDKSYLKAVVAVMGSQINYASDTLSLSNEPFRYNFEDYKDARVALALTYNRKLSTRTKFKTGLHANQIFFNYFREDQARNSSSNTDPYRPLGVSIDGSGNTQTLQYYAQLSHHLTDRLTAHGGVHVLALTANEQIAADPRLGLRYQLNERNRLSLGYGLHSQILPLGTYFYTDSMGNQPNRDLKFLKSHHLILGYKIFFPNKLSIGTEIYAQYLYNVPVRPEADEAYWMLNQQSGYPTFPLISDGTGWNYGVDLSVEKYFAKGFFMLLTGSFFNSTYRNENLAVNPSLESFNTKFGTRWISSYTIAKEFTFKKASVLQIGTKTMFNGGFRYTPYDPVLSAQAGSYVPLAGAAWGAQVPAFFRIDGRVSYRVNRPKMATVLSLDVQNVANRPNMRAVGYNSVTNELEFQKHPSGLVPVLSWQVDF